MAVPASSMCGRLVGMSFDTSVGAFYDGAAVAPARLFLRTCILPSLGVSLCCKGAWRSSSTNFFLSRTRAACTAPRTKLISAPRGKAVPLARSPTATSGLYWVGNIISNVGGWMQNVAQAWLLYHLTGNVFLVGLNGLFHSIPFIIMCLYAGTVVDRVDRKRLLFIVEAVSTGIVVVMGTLVITEHVQVWHIYASSVCYSLMGAFESPTRQALIPHLIPRRDLMTAVSLNSIVRKGAQIIGPDQAASSSPRSTLAARLLHPRGRASCPAWLPASDAGDQSRGGAHAPAGAAGDRGGFRYVRSQPILLALLLMETCMSIFGSYQAMMVVFARDVFNTGPQGLGVLQSAAGAEVLSARLRSPVSATCGIRGACSSQRDHLGVALVAFSYCPWFILAMVFLAIAGASDIVFGATRTTIMQMRARPDMLGRVMSLPVSPCAALATSGIPNRHAGDFIGVQGAVAVGAVVCIAFTVGAAFKVPLVRNFSEPGMRRARTVGATHDAAPRDSVRPIEAGRSTKAVRAQFPILASFSGPYFHNLQ